MSRGKLAKFADMERYENVFEQPYCVAETAPFAMKGRWREMYFCNNNPIVLELGCGRGEYTVGLAKLFPEVNFIGVDIKGARMWSGATQALKENIANVAFLRTNIEIIDRFFGTDEVQEIWLTFSDPQMKNPRKRLTCTLFLERYRRILVDGGVVHLKTDSNFLFTYTTLVVQRSGLPVEYSTDDLYGQPCTDSRTEALLGIRTYYESQWIERGMNIRYIRFLLPHDARLEEPGVEIAFDDYRSYKRTRRSERSAGL